MDGVIPSHAKAAVECFEVMIDRGTEDISPGKWLRTKNPNLFPKTTHSGPASPRSSMSMILGKILANRHVDRDEKRRTAPALTSALCQDLRTISAPSTFNVQR